MSNRLELPYNPSIRQRVFHASDAKYRLYGGAAGGGKSEAILMEAFMQALQFPGLNVLLLRKTFPELEKSLILRMHDRIPARLYKYNDQKKVATLINGSKIWFGHLENKKDVIQYQSAEFGAIGWDELTHFSFEEWTYLRTRNRSSVKGHKSNMFAATNPGGVGHAWVKALWVDRKPAPGMDPKHYLVDEYSFTPAKVEDNPYLMANDPSYAAELDRLPDALRLALREGSWDIFAGQYFANFSQLRHVADIPPPPSHWPRWISIDWGFQHNTAIYYHTHDGRRYITYREQVFNQHTGRQIGEKIAKTCQAHHEKPEAVYLSPDAFARRQDEHTVAIQIGDALLGADLPRPTAADNDRVGGWQLMYDLLEQDKWVIDRSCTKLIEGIPLMIRDADYPEDCVKANGDDSMDSARYGLKTRAKEVAVPLEEQIAARLAHIPLDDLTSRMIARIGIESQLRKAETPIRFARYGRAA